MEIYRADKTNKTEGKFFALELHDALAYRHNPGFGCSKMYKAETDGLNIRNIEREESDFIESIIGENWMDKYQTEAWALEAPEVIAYMAENNIDGLRFLDDYPNEASVFFFPNGLTMEKIEISEEEGLVIGLKKNERLFIELAKEYLAGKVWESEDNYVYDISDFETGNIVDLLKNGKGNDGYFVLEIRK